MGTAPLGTITIFAAVINALVAATPAHAGEPLRIVDGVTVTMEYTIRLPDESLYYSNVGTQPLSFRQGSKTVVPGLEKVITGMLAGDEKVALIPKEGAYGPYSPMKRISVPKEDAPPDAAVGSILVSPDGKSRVAVLDVREDSVLLDFNHPLAGKDLIFEITILNVEAPNR